MSSNTASRKFKGICLTNDNSILLTGYANDTLDKKAITYKVNLPYLFTMVHQRAEEVNKMVSTLNDLKMEHIGDDSRFDEIIAYVYRDNPIPVLTIETAPNLLATELNGSLRDVLGEPFTWVISAAILMLTLRYIKDSGRQSLDLESIGFGFWHGALEEHAGVSVGGFIVAYGV
ncbi:uncharacterized protein BP5553_06581 [Venustampulla echinocandica]|uniref:Uncharacterized protein n=1 Tax=Venustampulla echinocandica TaxID=2656787 RepID=A0A370TKB8_9HELO|nr:uncharacterized protein BP5553_06581 [Venustampulla echinocandica]RDL35969.1 hypothetical protein BP5553_06581 [Venustampulla echinocandica]